LFLVYLGALLLSELEKLGKRGAVDLSQPTQHIPDKTEEHHGNLNEGSRHVD
jgi:hypothetical protein